MISIFNKLFRRKHFCYYYSIYNNGYLEPTKDYLPSSLGKINTSKYILLKMFGTEYNRVRKYSGGLTKIIPFVKGDNNSFSKCYAINGCDYIIYNTKDDKKMRIGYICYLDSNFDAMICRLFPIPFVIRILLRSCFVHSLHKYPWIRDYCVMEKSVNIVAFK